jgi:uncharacterized protein (TIGR02145 family)
MKRFTIISLIIVLFALVVKAQQDTMYIHKTGGLVMKVSVSEIDSILFYSSGGGNTVTDIDGNVYSIVTIGTQQWLGQNLKVIHYSDGTPIPLETGDDNWSILSTPAYCWYGNDISNKEPYGAIYNWFVTDELSNGGKNVCPEGWHVPDDGEWTVLTDYLGGLTAAGGMMKETGTTHWNSPNSGATNESGFTALPGGARSGTDGSFISMNEKTYWWSSEENYASSGWYRNLVFNSATAYRHHLGKDFGYSVRCLKDD